MAIIGGLSKSTKAGIPIFIAGYLKRLLEGRYDALFATKLGEKLKNAGERQKYGIEFLLNILNALMDKKIQTNSSLGILIKELISDIPSEVSIRMLNQRKEKIAQVRDILLEETSDPDWNLIFDLEEEMMINLLNWIYGRDLAERQRILLFVQKLSPAHLNHFIVLPDEVKSKAAELAVPSVALKEKVRTGDGARVLKELTSSIHAKREYLRKIRKGGAK